MLHLLFLITTNNAIHASKTKCSGRATQNTCHEFSLIKSCACLGSALVRQGVVMSTGVGVGSAEILILWLSQPWANNLNMLFLGYFKCNLSSMHGRQ